MKDLTGTNRADRANPNEPKPEVVLLAAPDWLSEQARDAFNELSSLFHAQKILTQMDEMALTLLCDQWHDYREARKFIEENGQYAMGIDSNGNTTYKNYPQMTTKATTYANIMRTLAEFGATPASRTKVKTSTTGEEDPFDLYMRKN